MPSCFSGWTAAGWMVCASTTSTASAIRREYLLRLRAAAPRAWIVVEKILEPGERLPDSWPIAGTTGYDFVNRVTGLFVDPDGEPPLTEFYTRFTGAQSDYAALVLEKNRLVLRELLGAEVNRLLGLLLRIAARHWRVRDFSPEELRAGLTELVACLSVYRTYARPETGYMSAADVARVNEALVLARGQRPDLDPDLFSFLGDLLLLRLRGTLPSEFVRRVQQVTGPAMAKGVEDTAFYCFNRFIALNEVGGDPARFGLTVEEFHRACAEGQARWPEAMLATSTHDTRHGEDMRARLSLLAEIPAQWGAAVRRWSALNERHRRDGLPGRNMEYLFYQTLVGAWPIELDRLRAYMDKAACEAKVRTTWTRRNAPYDEALQAFVTDAVGDPQFMADLEQFVRPLVAPGYVHSLAQILLKLTAPGVPDTYQGTELWDWSLVRSGQPPAGGFRRAPLVARTVDRPVRRSHLAAPRRRTAQALAPPPDAGPPAAAAGMVRGGESLRTADGLRRQGPPRRRLPPRRRRRHSGAAAGPPLAGRLGGHRSRTAAGRLA